MEMPKVLKRQHTIVTFHPGFYRLIGWGSRVGVQACPLRSTNYIYVINSQSYYEILWLPQLGYTLYHTTVEATIRRHISPAKNKRTYDEFSSILIYLQ